MVWSVQGDENKRKKKNIFTNVSVIEQNNGTYEPILQNQLKCNMILPMCGCKKMKISESKK